LWERRADIGNRPVPGGDISLLEGIAPIGTQIHSHFGLGRLFFVLYGAGSFPITARGWATWLVKGLLLGVFIGALTVVNNCREKKKRSLTELEREVRSSAERELNQVFVVIGAALGASIAYALDTPQAGRPTASVG
jgi:hypothetical protein